MALLSEALRSLIKTSLFGRRIGLDNNDYLVGPLDVRNQIEDVTSTVPTTVSAYGLTRILTSGSSQGPVQHNLPNPVVGVQKIIGLNTTSTGSYQFLAQSGQSILAASDGTTKALFNMLGQGGVITLEGLTSSIWMVCGVSSTAGVSYTTST